jgi:putative transposase
MELDEKEFDPVSKRGNNHKYTKRTIVNAILYVVKSGIQW